MDPPPVSDAGNDEVVSVLQETRRVPDTRRSFTDWYVVVLGAVLMVASVVSYLVLRETIPGCVESTCFLATESSSLAVLLGFALLTYGIGLLRGPVGVTAAEAFWVFSSPLARGPLLARRKAGILLGHVGGGAVMGLVHFIVWNANPWWLIAFPAWSLLATSLAALVQGRSAGARTTPLVVLTAGSIAAGLAAVAPPSGIALSAATVAGVAALTGGALFALTSRRAWRRSDSLPLQNLRRARSAGDAVAGAVSAADSGLLLDVVTLRLLGSRSFVHRFRLRGKGWRAVLSAEVRRCFRSPLLLARTVLFLAVLTVGHLADTPELLAGISLSSLLYTSLNASAFRGYVTSRGLARSFPQSPAIMRSLLTLPHALFTVSVVLVFSVVATFLPGPTLPDWPTIGVATVAGVAGGIRWATTTPTQFSAGVVMTEAGPVHVSAILNAVRGVDVILLLTISLLTGLDPLLCLSLALVMLIRVVLRD